MIVNDILSFKPISYRVFVVCVQLLFLDVDYDQHNMYTNKKCKISEHLIKNYGNESFSTFGLNSQKVHILHILNCTLDHILELYYESGLNVSYVNAAFIQTNSSWSINKSVLIVM